MIDTVWWKSSRHAREISLPVFTGLVGHSMSPVAVRAGISQ